MATRTLYLTSTAASSPYPTSSRLLVENANASEVTLGPGEFDSGLPGNSDAGQWNPNSALADTTAAAEIDNAGGANPTTTRQGWLWNQDLTGQVLAADTAWTFQLRLRANQGTGTLARFCARVSIVTASGGVWTTVKSLFTTRVTGATSTSGGQAGWRDIDARITVTSTAANFSRTIGGSGTVLGHTFASGERILVELGFNDADSTADRTWRLDFNTSNSFVTTPNIAPGPQTLTAPRLETDTAVHAPTVTVGAVALSPPRVDADATVHAPTVTAPGPDQELTPPRLNAGSVAHAPAVTRGAVTVTPPRTDVDASALAPTVTVGPVAVAPPRLLTGAALHPPTVTPGAVSVAPPRGNAAAAVLSPTISAGGAVLVAPRTNTGAAVRAPTVTPGSVPLLPPRVAAGATGPPPTVLPGAVTVTAPRTDVGAVARSPAVDQGAQDLAVPLVACGAAAPAPVVFIPYETILIVDDTAVTLLVDDTSITLTVTGEIGVVEHVAVEAAYYGPGWEPL